MGLYEALDGGLRTSLVQGMSCQWLLSPAFEVFLFFCFFRSRFNMRVFSGVSFPNVRGSPKWVCLRLLVVAPHLGWILCHSLWLV